MDILFEKSNQKINQTSTDFVRSIFNEINWDAQLIGIKGARGIGKTTLLLQYIKIKLKNDIEKTLYVTLDNIWFSNNSLYEMVDTFVKKGGLYLFLDEVHKYSNWSQELKNIYDDFPTLKVVFTGSSLLEILNSRADLSRRANIYHMQGLSFREYLSIETKVDFKIYSLSDILDNHLYISTEILTKIKPLQYFDQYLKKGYYPFYKKDADWYYNYISEIINLMLEIELPVLRGVAVAYVKKIQQLLQIISESVPFIPNVSKLSEKIIINRGTLLSYFHFLDEVGITKNLYKEAQGISKLQKPVKIFLENTNIMYALSPQKVNVGNLRESFFLNQLSYRHEVTYSEHADFFIDQKFTFEIGGKHKSRMQIAGLKNAFVAADALEFGHQNTIPLWLFGFLY